MKLQPSPLLLKEGRARSAGVVLKEPRSAPIKVRFASISGGFASLENHPDSLREPPFLQKEGSCLTFPLPPTLLPLTMSLNRYVRAFTARHRERQDCSRRLLICFQSSSPTPLPIERSSRMTMATAR